MRRAALLLIVTLSGPVHACWEQAAQRYGVPANLLHAMAKVESGLNPRALNLSHRARSGTIDLGLMQINSGNFKALARLGIRERDLYDPCTNIHVGAWILAQKVARHGMSWEAVGAYNAACSQLKGADCVRARSQYAWRVYRSLRASLRFVRHAPAPTATAMPIVITARVSP
jgi:soluble lytic murein transglycosylase-like protein